MTIPRPCERVAVCYESTMRGYLELRVRSYDSKDPDVAELFASEHVYVREDVAEAESAALRRERDALRAEVEALRSHLGRALRMFKDETSGGDGMREEALRLRLCAGATVTP